MSSRSLRGALVRQQEALALRPGDPEFAADRRRSLVRQPQREPDAAAGPQAEACAAAEICRRFDGGGDAVLALARRRRRDREMLGTHGENALGRKRMTVQRQAQLAILEPAMRGPPLGA